MTGGELDKLLRQTSRGITLSCRVQPRASRNAIAGVMGDSLKIALTAPPVDGKANAELCRFLADKAGLPKSSVSILSGETSRTKVILFSGIELHALRERLCH